MATIYCFSSTGNSLDTANKIAGKINAEIKPMTIQNEICSDDIIGFVFPAYFWSLPVTVERFLNEIEITDKDAYIFVVVTYGTRTPGIIGLADKILCKKNVRISYSKLIKHVENYNISFTVDDTDDVIECAEKNISECAEKIKSKATNTFSNNNFMNSIAHSIFPAKNPEKCSSKLSVSDACTGCGICEKICPQGNITLTDGKISFNGHCEHCLGCIHACPKQAISWAGKTDGKKRYINHNVKVTDIIALNQRNK